MLNMCTSCKYFDTCGDFDRVEPCTGYAPGIAPLYAIDNALDAARKNRDDLKSVLDAKHANYGAFYDAKKAARLAGDAARLGALTEAAAAALDDIAATEDKKRALDDAIAVLNNNRIVSIMYDALPAIKTAFMKYARKPYGEKTRAKIADEIKTYCGVRAYIDTTLYNRNNINVYTDIHGARDIYIYSAIDPETNTRPQFLIDNKINPAAFNALECNYNPGRYVVNIEEYLKERAARREAIKAAEKALSNAAAVYNNLSVLDNDRALTVFNTGIR